MDLGTYCQLQSAAGTSDHICTCSVARCSGRLIAFLCDKRPTCSRHHVAGTERHQWISEMWSSPFTEENMNLSPGSRQEIVWHVHHLPTRLRVTCVLYIIVVWLKLIIFPPVFLADRTQYACPSVCLSVCYAVHCCYLLNNTSYSKNVRTSE